ncbi:gephyrin-like molybdotransferase Glp [Salinibacterium sp.]|uniref:molybdopterin molybdotransferase MoeA n=1 Tax=Salinibacterium sp. TaxID=1915057 RepID=UPI00286A257D|nr:gephyrin-like molybdotransferase Glp [Salinibacterium sp.]
MPHTSVDDHAALVAAMLAPALMPRPETVPLDDALDRVTASAVASPVDLPLFRNSQMDGYAVVAADLATLPVTLPIAGEIAARPSDPLPLLPGSAVRIMTGGVMPRGADAVVPVEDTTVDGNHVTITRPRSAGDFVRNPGSDIHRGDRLLPGGLRLASRHLAALAAAGLTTIDVVARVTVAVITTGSELVPPGVEPVLGQVFDSNGTALAAAVRAAGGVVTFRTHVLDDRDAMLAALHRATAADVILTSGGISMGDYEVVRETLEPFGARVGHVAMQPGGPQATAVFEGTPVICFPGNPVSTQLSFEVFVAPLLREVAGLPAAVRRWRPLTAGTASMAGKRQFLRGRADAEGRVTLVAGPGSHLVAGLAASTVLVIVPEQVTELAAGDSVETWEL